MRNIQEAEEACSTCVELFPDKPTSHYNLATLKMLNQDREGALGSLARNVELGDLEFDYLETDPIFFPLRGDLEFQALLAKMRLEAASKDL